MQLPSDLEFTIAFSDEELIFGLFKLGVAVYPLMATRIVVRMQVMWKDLNDLRKELEVAKDHSCNDHDTHKKDEFTVHSSVQGDRASLLRLQQRHCLLILSACPLWRWASSFSSVQLRRCLFSSAAPLPLESCGKTLALFGSSFSGSLLCKVRVRLCEAQESRFQAPPSQPQSLWPLPTLFTLSLSASQSQTLSGGTHSWFRRTPRLQQRRRTIGHSFTAPPLLHARQH
ncbi:hypothetical protein NE237_026563 [Protea cynaroides]|uniref:Uncharacterized protein n=1 Tax=Protea cynaroides TaxID=273540 RepID=A0A9Q0H3Z0_9MAGN|nr:hypothetical protein NE237_026563 [Protea cynaroides]